MMYTIIGANKMSGENWLVKWKQSTMWKQKEWAEEALATLQTAETDPNVAYTIFEVSVDQ